MAVRALGGIVRSNVSDRKVFNFAGCDLAVPAPAIFSGGGNRTRRRIHGAVGPSRTNLQPRSEDLSHADGWVSGSSCSATLAAESIEGSPFWELTKSSTSNSESRRSNAHAVLSGEIYTLTIALLAGTSSQADMSMYHWTLSEGTNGESTITKLSGPATVVQQYGSLARCTGLSATVPTVVQITRRFAADGNVDIYIYPGTYASTTATDSVKATRVHFGRGIALGPYIPTDASPVTTTDWPRRTLNGNGTTPQYGDGGWWSTDGTADLLPSNVLGPTGHPMSKLARRATGVTDGCYAYQGNLTFIAGEKYARRIVAQAGDNVGDLVFVELATSPGVYIANGTINVRTGEVPTVNNGTIVLMGRIGKQFIFELRGTAPASVATGYCSWIIPFAGALGTGHYFGCDQTELGEVCTAHMHSGLGQYGSAVTPPFGQLVPVDAGKPRIEYGPDGFARGVKVFGPAANNIAYSGVNPGQYYYYVTEDCAASFQTMWDPLVGHFIRVTKTAGGAGPTYRAGVRQDVTGMLGPASSVDVKVRFNGAGAKGYAPYMDINDAGGGVHTNSLYYTSPPLGEWIDSSRSVNASVMVGTGSFYIWNEGPVGTSIDFAMPQCNAGNHLHEYIPTDGSAGASDAEALQFTDMDAFGLNQDAWTIIVEATEPAIEPAGYPMIYRATGPGGVVATINKQPDGTVEFQIYDGAANVARSVAAGTPGSVRRYLIGFDRASQTMRYGATGATVADATGASLATVGPYTVVQIASADGFWWCNNTTAKVEVVKRLLLKEECQQEIAL